MKNRKRLIIFVIIIIVIIGASAATAIFLSQRNSSNDPQEDNKQTTATLERLPSEKKADEADKLARDGDVEGGARQLDEAIENTDDSYEKFVYYSRKATLLYNHGDLAGALDAALKAYELEKTSDSAAFVGQIAREKGDRAMALDYYKKAIPLIDPNDPFAGGDKVYYEGIISEIEAGQ